MEGKHVPAVDVKQATIDCMRHPIGSAPLQEKVQKGDKVCLVVADVTRTWNHSNQFLIYIIDELNLAGIPDDDIYIVFAQGSHRAPDAGRRRPRLRRKSRPPHQDLSARLHGSDSRRLRYDQARHTIETQ